MEDRGKSGRIPIFIRRSAAYGSLTVGVCLLIWAASYFQMGSEYGISISLKRFCVGLGGLMTLLGLWMAFRPKFLGINLRLLLASFSWLYLGLEIGRFLLIGIGAVEGRNPGYEGGWGVFTQPCAEFDPVRGYRWLNSGARVAKITRGEVSFNQAIQPNRQGWIDKNDFTFAKQDSSVKRWMVFGDSYTGSEFLASTWVDVAENTFKARLRGNPPPELYNFGIDGGGLWNWHSTFFGEVTPQYEFDGIVLAVYGNDFDRDFAIFQHTDSVAWFKYFKEKPSSQTDFEENFLPKMDRSAEMMDEDELFRRINEIQAKKVAEIPQNRVHFPSPDLYFLMRMHDRYQAFDYNTRKAEFEEMYGASQRDKMEDYSELTFAERYGEMKWNMLSEMMAWCKANGKDVVFASVPDEQGLHFNKRGDFTVVQGEVNWLANQFGARYFDGYGAFSDIPDENLHAYFLRYDMHWNEMGSFRFGERFADWLLEEQPK